MAHRFAVLALLVAVTMAESNFVSMFEQFKSKYSRKYASAAEEAKKFRVFVANMKKAAKLQAANPKASFGANEFADMTAEEFKIRHSAEKYYKARATDSHRGPVKSFSSEEVRSMPQTIDWRAKGAVTPVKNQGQCGSCWSFSTTGSIEGQWFLAGNKLTSASEQELVSCDTNDNGCGGGLMDNAFSWLITAQGGNIVTEASYPYVSGGGNAPTCSLNNKTMPVAGTIVGYVMLPGNEAQMAAFVGANGPLSIAVDATSWQTYNSGILTNCISNQIDHGVLIVGYDLTNSPPYWIIKNSWGAAWGENGYIRVEYGTDQCLITTYPTSSNASHSGPAPTTPSGGSWTQLECKDFKCKDCKSTVMTQGACNVATGFSYSGTCAADGVIISYYNNNDCSGTPAKVSVDPINQCSIVADFFGPRFIENECEAAPTAPPTTATPVTQQPTVAPTTAYPTIAPTTPLPTTAAPTSPGNFSMTTCSDVNCTQNCAATEYRQNMCYPSSSGSFIGLCTVGGLNYWQFTSSDCSGGSDEVELALDTCLQNPTGYFSVSCNATTAH